MRGTRRQLLTVEWLEMRRLLAGNVTANVSGGVLSLVGDDFGNVVTFAISPSAVTLTPDSTTDVGSGPGVVRVISLPKPLASLRADLGGGDDSLTAALDASLALPAGVSVRLGDGDDLLGLATDQSLALGPVTIRGGDGNDRVGIAGAAGSRIKGALTIDGGSGPLDVSLRQFEQSGGSVSISGTQYEIRDVTVSGVRSPSAWRVSAGGGGGRVRFREGTNLGAVTISGGAVSVELQQSTMASLAVAVQLNAMASIDQSTVTRAFTMSASGPGGSVVLDSQVGPTRFGDVTLTALGRASSVYCTVGAGASLGSLTARGHSLAYVNLAGSVSRQVTVESSGLGSQARAVLDGVAIGGAVRVASSLVGGSVASLKLQEAVTAAGITVSGGGAATLQVIDGSQAAVTGDVIVTAKTGAVQCDVTGALEARGITLQGDQSANLALSSAGDLAASGAFRMQSPGEVGIYQDSSGSLRVAGDAVLAGGIRTQLQHGTPTATVFQRGLALRGDVVNLDVLGTLFVGGTLTADATAGSYRLGGGSQVVGNASFTGGRSISGMTQFVAEGTMFMKSLSVDFGDVSSEVVLGRSGTTNTTIGGQLTIRTGAARDRVTLVGLVASGAATIDTGMGQDTVNIDATVFGRTLQLRTGGGNDVFRCAQNESTPVTFNGVVSADLGDGDDELLLGMATIDGALVAFNAPGSRIEGGRGRNRFDKANSQIVNPANVTITDFQQL